VSTSSQRVARFVTVTMGLVIALSFLFGFGNVLSLALKLLTEADRAAAIHLGGQDKHLLAIGV
jgi:hypothetical protein